MPKPELLLICSVPLEMVEPPPKVLPPPSTSVPGPTSVRLRTAPLITPPTVKVLPPTVTVRLPPKTTAPEPMSSGLLPAKVKSPFQFCALLVPRATGAPSVLSMMPPLMVKGPLPMAELFNELPPLLMLRVVPGDRMVPPE